MCFVTQPVSSKGLLACLQVGLHTTDMPGYLVPGPPVRLCVSLTCILSLWNTGGSDLSSRVSVLYAEFGFSLDFGEWQESTSLARILNESDRLVMTNSPFLVLSSDFLQLSLISALSHYLPLHCSSPCLNRCLPFPGPLRGLSKSACFPSCLP